MSNRSGPPPHEPRVTGYSPPGAGGPRKGVSPALIITGVVLGVLVLAGVLIWLVVSLISEIGFSLGPDGPEPPAAQRSAPAVPGAADTTASDPGPSADGTAAASGFGKVTPVRVPTDGALASAKGTFSAMVLEEKSSDAVRIPDHDEPLLVVWSNSSPKDNGTFFLTGYDRSGGDITDSLSIVRDGQTGMQLIDLGSGDPRTRVLYPKGNQGVSWRVAVFPLSAVPEAPRGERLTGNGPAALRLPAGKAGEYRLTVKDEGVPTIEVYDADDLDLWTQFDYGTAPVDLDVSVGAGEQIIQVNAESEWLLEPR